MSCRATTTKSGKTRHVSIAPALREVHTTSREALAAEHCPAPPLPAQPAE